MRRLASAVAVALLFAPLAVAAVQLVADVRAPPGERIRQGRGRTDVPVDAPAGSAFVLEPPPGSAPCYVALAAATYRTAPRVTLDVCVGQVCRAARQRVHDNS